MSKLFHMFVVCVVGGLGTATARADEVVGAIWQVKNKIPLTVTLVKD